MNGIKTIIAVAGICFAGTAWSYSGGKPTVTCMEPIYRDFIPAQQVKGQPVPEVEAGSVIGFSVHRKPDPTTIRAEVKDLKLKLDIDHRNTFTIVKATLPPELNGKYARINIYAMAQKGECKSKDGWLIKVKDAAPVVEAEPEAEAEVAVTVEE